jgi:hypothetical protein
MNDTTTFKIRIDTISPIKIGFELFVGDRVRDTYMNVLSHGSYGVKNRILLTPREFTDFAVRLIGYVYTTKKIFTDEEIKILWELKVNIFDHEAQQLSKSIFQNETNHLVKLGLVKEK